MPDVLLVLATSTGGVGTHVRALAEGLRGRGVAVRVAGPRATEGLFGFAAAGAEFVPVEVGPRAPAVLSRAARGVAVVHAHGLRAGVLAALAPARRAPLVVTWHNAGPAGGVRGVLHAGLEAVAARRAAVTLAASADLAATARARGGRDVRLGPVAAPPLPPPRRSPDDVRAELGAVGRPLVVAVGRLAPQKRFDVLVDAAAALAGRAPAPLVVVAGDGPARPGLEARIAASAAPVRLLGRRGDVSDLLAAADVAVLTSDWEARALVAQEALRAGVPLVATAVGGVPDLVGDAALLVPPGDAAAVAAAVGRVLDEPALRSRLAGRGPVRAAGWPSADDTVAQVLAVYQELGLAG